MQHERVLDWVNQIRKEYQIGAPLDTLPKGKQFSCIDCPIARAIRGSAGPREACVYVGGRETGVYAGVIVLPQVVQNFIIAFDRGEFPELRA